jgi:YbbR domain-containing protein
MRVLRDWVLHNWALKLLALGLSFLLWTTYKSEPVVEIGYNVPIAYVSIPRNLEISNEAVTQVHVRLRGRAALLRRITPADIDVHVNLSRLPAGQNTVPLDGSAVTVPYGAQVVRMSPEQVSVVLSPRHTSPSGP